MGFPLGMRKPPFTWWFLGVASLTRDYTCLRDSWLGHGEDFFEVVAVVSAVNFCGCDFSSGCPLAELCGCDCASCLGALGDDGGCGLWAVDSVLCLWCASCVFVEVVGDFLLLLGHCVDELLCFGWVCGDSFGVGDDPLGDVCGCGECGGWRGGDCVAELVSGVAEFAGELLLEGDGCLVAGESACECGFLFAGEDGVASVMLGGFEVEVGGVEVAGCGVDGVGGCGHVWVPLLFVRLWCVGADHACLAGGGLVVAPPFLLESPSPFSSYAPAAFPGLRF